jgi:hypothetical protein
MAVTTKKPIAAIAAREFVSSASGVKYFFTVTAPSSRAGGIKQKGMGKMGRGK